MGARAGFEFFALKQFANSKKRLSAVHAQSVSANLANFFQFPVVISSKMSPSSDSNGNSSSSALLPPKEAAEFIVKHAEDVSIEPLGIESVAKTIYDEILAGKLSSSNFKQWELHPQEANERAIDWIFLADTLNFSFWSGDPVSSPGKKIPKWEVEYKGKCYTGYFALCAGINRAIDEGMDILNPSVFGALTEADILRIFQSVSSTPIPMVADRVKNLQEASKVLLDKYQGSFVNCVKAAEGSAQTLLKLIVEDFGSYRDESVYKEQKVAFWKRAQILVGDIWVCFQGKELGAFHDIETLTIFADYRIPQVLLYFEAIKYSKRLTELLEEDTELENGDPLEIEIRGASIHASELIRDQVKAKYDKETSKEKKAILDANPINTVLVDHFLWDYRRRFVEELDKFPYHKVRCIYY